MSGPDADPTRMTPEEMCEYAIGACRQAIAGGPDYYQRALRLIEGHAAATIGWPSRLTGPDQPVQLPLVINLTHQEPNDATTRRPTRRHADGHGRPWYDR